MYDILRNIVKDNKTTIMLNENNPSDYLEHIIKYIGDKNDDDEFSKKLIVLRKIKNNRDKILNIYSCFNNKYENKTLIDLYNETGEEFSKNKKYIRYHHIINTIYENKKIDQDIIIKNLDVKLNEEKSILYLGLLTKSSKFFIVSGSF